MDRIQRNGLIALLVLILVALGGRFLGSKSEAGIPIIQEALALDPSALPGVDLLPPAQRRLFVKAQDFTLHPLPSPLESKPVSRPVPASGRISSLKVAPATFPVERVIRVREDETLSEIAARELGSALRWREIAELNALADPGALTIGQPLRIPLNQPPAKVAEKAVTARTWVVESGQTPGEISLQVYGDSRLWRKLLAANGIEDPRSLREGTVLEIPPLD